MVSSPQQSIAKKDRPVDLPEFEKPPVVEVVLGIQFSELRRYRTFHAGLLWGEKFRKAGFPKCVERPSLDPAFETFGAPGRNESRLQLIQMPGPEVPRLWFINHDETELVQIQSDRFLHNWRKSQGNARYPRYEAIRERFFGELMELESFLSEEGIGSIEPNQCEVTYVNHISLGEADPWSHVDKMFEFFASGIGESRQSHGGLVDLEDGRFRFRFVIRDTKTRSPLGRLHVEAQAASEGDGKSIIRLNLTARGTPVSPTFQGIADFLDIGRFAIVDTFTAITTKEMHQLWRRIK